MTGSRYAVAGLLCLALLVFAVGKVSAAEPLEVTASLEGSHASGYAISFGLNNVSNKPLVIKRRHLPWSQSATSGLVISAVSREDGGKVLPVGHSMHNPPGEISLQQRQTIRGKLELDRIIPNLRSSLEHYDVVVHWTYFPEVGDAVLAPKGGWFVVKRSIQ